MNDSDDGKSDYSIKTRYDADGNHMFGDQYLR